MSEKAKGEPYNTLHRFTFRCKNKLRYIFLAEEYDHDVYAVKFHLKALTHSKNRYEMMTNFFDAPAILGTCLSIMNYILQTNPKASFVFSGSPLANEHSGQPTKRYRVYQKIVENLFSPFNYYHYPISDRNIYMLLNRQNDNPRALAEWITSVLLQNYDF